MKSTMFHFPTRFLNLWLMMGEQCLMWLVPIKNLDQKYTHKCRHTHTLSCRDAYDHTEKD